MFFFGYFRKVLSLFLSLKGIKIVQTLEKRERWFVHDGGGREGWSEGRMEGVKEGGVDGCYL